MRSMVSVVMATFNGEKYLEKQLNSILMQTLLPDEILIFDDRSVDKTEEIVNQFIKKNTTSVEIKFVKNETNLGYALNFYQGLKYARGDYIFLSDQDDIWYANKIEIIVKIMKKNKKISALNTAYILIDDKGKEIKNYLSKKFKDNEKLKKIDFFNFIKSPRYPGMAMCINKRILPQLQRIERGDIIAHDWLLNLIASENNEMYFLDKILTKYRQHFENTYGLTCTANKKNIKNNHLLVIDDLIKLARSGENIYIEKDKCNYFKKYKLVLEERKRLVVDNCLFKIFINYIKNHDFISQRCFLGDIYTILISKIYQ